MKELGYVGHYHTEIQAFPTATRGGRRDTVKLYVLLSVCMYSHRISAAVLDSMNTESLVSGLNTIKRILKASFLPSIDGMTQISFVRAVQMSVHTVNLHPVCLLPHDAATPGELNAVSPTALRGPDSAGWPALGRSRDFTGQMACLQKQQESFRQKWRTFYTKVIRQTHNMAQNGEGFSVCGIFWG